MQSAPKKRKVGEDDFIDAQVPPTGLFHFATTGFRYVSSLFSFAKQEKEAELSEEYQEEISPPPDIQAMPIDDERSKNIQRELDLLLQTHAISGQNAQEALIQLIRLNAFKDIEEAQRKVSLNLNMTDSNMQTAVHHAAKEGDEALLKKLIGLGLNIDAKDANNCTPLHLACMRNREGCVKILLREKAKCNETNDMGKNPIHYAAIHGNVSIMRDLIDNHANVDALTAQQESALTLALYDKKIKKPRADYHAQIAMLLLQAKAKLTGLPEHFTLMLDALSYGHVNLLKEFISNGVSINAPGVAQSTLLHEVVKRRPNSVNDASIIEELVKLGANPQAKDKEGAHPLHYVTNICDAQALCKNIQTDLAITDNDGNTPIMRATHENREEVVKWMLANGADPLVVNKTQQCIMHLAKRNDKHSPFSKWLKSQITIAPPQLKELETQLDKLISACSKAASAQNKKLLVLLGESHGNYHVYQREKALLKSATPYLTHLMFEGKMFLSSFVSNSLILNYNKKHLKYTVVGVDNNRSGDTQSDVSNPGMVFRDFGMQETIHKINQPSVYPTGAAHLYGLVERAGTKIDTNQYFIVPIVVCPSRGYLIYDTSTPEGFYHDPTKVIQVGDNNSVNLKQAIDVIKKWNKCDISLENKRNAPF